MTECSVCNTEVPSSATTCSNCGAMKGYVIGGRARLPYGPIRTVLFGVIVPGLIALWAFQSWDQGIFWRVVAIFFMLPVVFCLYRLLRGPRWYPLSKIGDR